MAAPVTEIVDFTIPTTIDHPTALSLLASAKTTLLSQPGCLGARFSLHHEKPPSSPSSDDTAAAATLFIDWDAISSHNAFASNAAVFGPMKTSLLPLAPTRPYHVSLDPTPPGVLDGAPVVEVLHLYFPGADAGTGLEREQATLKTLRGFAEITEREARDMGVVGTPTLGWVVEEWLEFKGEKKTRVLVLMLGWRSVEAHMAYRETEAFRDSIGMVRGLEGLLGMKMYHVSCGEA